MDHEALGPERSAFIATFAGWMLDGMDVMVYSLVLPVAFVVAYQKGQAGLLSTSTLLISSLGGWLAGILADRFGRVRILKITIFWFAFFTFFSGFTQNFEQLLIARGLQGLGFGGEWAVGARSWARPFAHAFAAAPWAQYKRAGRSDGASASSFTILFSHFRLRSPGG